MKPTDTTLQSDVTRVPSGSPVKTRLLAVFDCEADCPPALLEQSPGSHAAIQIDRRVATDAAALHGLLERLRPRLLLVDMRWLQRLPIDEVGALRRQRIETDWMVVWQDGDEKDVDLVIRCHAVGGIDWNIDRPTFERAVQSALRGELWFPRSVMQQLYLTLRQGDSAQNESAIDKGSGLSLRQAQALALMREGLTNKQIAARLGVSVNTVKKHLALAFLRAGLHSRRQLFS